MVEIRKLHKSNICAPKKIWKKFIYKYDIVDRFFETGVAPLTLNSMTSGFNIATNISTDNFFTAM